MNDKEIVDKMIIKVEEIVREKVKENFNEAKTTARKGVSKTIINELDKVIKDEN